RPGRPVGDAELRRPREGGAAAGGDRPRRARGDGADGHGARQRPARGGRPRQGRRDGRHPAGPDRGIRQGRLAAGEGPGPPRLVLSGRYAVAMAPPPLWWLLRGGGPSTSPRPGPATAAWASFVRPQEEGHDDSRGVGRAARPAGVRP